MDDRNYSKGALALILAAEKLFGAHGIDGVSLRQIVSAAGLVNSYSVQHHFGSKQGLIQAVYDYRAPTLEEGCRQRLAQLKLSGTRSDIAGLIAARFMPLVDCFNASAQQSYSLFLLRLLHLNEMSHPLTRSKVPQPASRQLDRLLRRAFPGLPTAVYKVRFRLASDLFFGAMIEKNRMKKSGRRFHRSGARYWTEVLLMMEALFLVPYDGTQ